MAVAMSPEKETLQHLSVADPIRSQPPTTSSVMRIGGRENRVHDEIDDEGHGHEPLGFSKLYESIEAEINSFFAASHP